MKKKLVTMLLASCILALTFSLTVCAEPVEVEAGVIFDAEYYAGTNPDVVNVLGDDEDVLYEHYKLYGAKEGRQPYEPTTSKEDLEKAKKAKKVKKVKTKKKLDKEYIEYANNYRGYEYFVKYGIYDDEKIDAELKILNDYRKSKGLPEFKVNKKLNKAAAMMALEYSIGYNFDKNGDKCAGFGTKKRPDGTSYTTAIKECGVKFKSSNFSATNFVNATGFVDDMIANIDSYKLILNSKKYTEVGIGYYSTSSGSYQTWVIIPISK